MNTCVVKSLVSTSGRKGGPADTKTVNQKNIRIASPRPVDFWIGARIRRYFSSGWFLGTITSMGVDEAQRWYTVDYDDGDQQELDTGEIWDMVSYHPRMDHKYFRETQLPAVGEAIVFALDQRLRLGVVQELHMQDLKPISTVLWKPQKNAPSLHLARFKPSENEGQTDIIRLSPVQIKLNQLHFNEEGFLDPVSQRKLARYLGGKQKAATPKAKMPRPPKHGMKKEASSTSHPAKSKRPEQTTGPHRSSRMTPGPLRRVSTRRAPPASASTRRYDLRPRRNTSTKPP